MLERMDNSSDEKFPHGTIRLERLLDRKHGEIILNPGPSSDPNWPFWYKALNFLLMSVYTLVVFVNVVIGTVIWADLHPDLNVSWSAMASSFAINCAGLAVGCVLFIPFALKLGRRPVYLVSITISLATGIWQARMMTTGDLLGINLVSRLAGSISEMICQMTIADVFFVHQRATCNGIYLLMVNIGAFWAPVAAGYAAASQGWRWIWWWTTILLAARLIPFIFLYEDTKYDPVDQGTDLLATEKINEVLNENGSINDEKMAALGITTTSTSRRLDERIPRKTDLQRLAVFQPGSLDGGWSMFFRHSYQPFVILCTFPAIT